MNVFNVEIILIIINLVYLYSMLKEVLKSVDRVARSEGIISYEISVPQQLPKGEGYSSEQFSITIQDKINDNKIKLIVKCAFNSEFLRSMFAQRQQFVNEIFFYSDLYEALKTLGDIDDLMPKCYSSCGNDGHEYLILEDLTVKQFKTLNKKEVLNYDQLKFIFKKYGKLHGFTYALKEKLPEIWDKYINETKSLFEIFFDSELFSYSFQNGFNLINKILLDKKVNKEIIDKIENYQSNFKDKSTNSLANDQDDFMTILHGDCWSNNMMVKINDNGNIEDIRFIDFQLSKIGSPCCDLSYFLYTSSHKNELDNLNELLYAYHQSLTETMEKLNCNPKNIMPFDELQRQWNKYSKFGFLMATLTLQGKLIIDDKKNGFQDCEGLLKNVADNISEDSKQTLKNMFEFDEDEYQKRLLDIILHMYEINAL